MAEASITINTVMDDSGIKALSKNLEKGAKDLKDMQSEMKRLSKDANAAGEEIEALSRKITIQKAINAQWAKELKKTTSELMTTKKEASGLKAVMGKLGDVSKSFGVNIDGVLSKVNATTLSMGAFATAIGAVATKLIQSWQEVSRLSNQFITFAGTTNKAQEMYNKFSDVARSSTYDEQAIFDMAKGLLAVGINADRASDLITKCYNASASLGKSVEFTNELVSAFERLQVGGQLTEKQYKALAEAGIDLSDVQEDMRAGGERAFNALSSKLDEYRNGMDMTKKTSEELSNDVKGDMQEILRQTSLLIDEMTGFSETLRSFYQWVLTYSGQVIQSIREMVSAVRDGKATLSIKEEYEDAYGTYEEAFEKGADAGQAWLDGYNNYLKSRKAEDANAEAWAEMNVKAGAKAPVSIAKAGGGGGSKSSSKSSDPLKEYKDRAKAIKETNAQEQQALKRTQALDEQYTKTKNANTLSLLSGEEKLREQHYQEQDAIRRKMMMEEEYTAKQVEGIQKMIDVYTEAKEAGVPNSEKYIEQLTHQKTVLEEELQAREKIYNLMLKTNENTEIQRRSTQHLKELYEKLGSEALGGMANALSNCILAGKDLGKSMQELFKQMLAEVLQLIAKWLILTALMGVAGGGVAKGGLGKWASNMRSSLFGNGGMVHASTGGLIVGGSSAPKADDVPAMLSQGEFVLNKNAVDAIGATNLMRMNASAGADLGSAGGRNITLNVSTMDASSFSDFLSRGAFDSIKQAFSDDDRMFASTSGTW